MSEQLKKVTVMCFDERKYILYMTLQKFGSRFLKTFLNKSLMLIKADLFDRNTVKAEILIQLKIIVFNFNTVFKCNLFL